MPAQALEITRSSAAVWGASTGIRKVPTVAKYFDASSCIGCKGCEVACQAWNDLDRTKTTQTGHYQTSPNLDSQLWNLIRFREYETNGDVVWVMHKDQCRHCADPGCLAACPAPGAIVQYANGIVDVDPSKCIGCGYCASGCPFDIPRFHPVTKKMTKCTLCVDRVAVGLEPACIKACPTGALQFGTKDAMLAVAKARVKQLHDNGDKSAVVYDPPGVAGTSVVAVLREPPGTYELPPDPNVPLLARFWKSVLRPAGVLLSAVAIVGTFTHYTKFGPKEPSATDVKELDQ
jgi:formate dehydrogenase beta subunit